MWFLSATELCSVRKGRALLSDEVSLAPSFRLTVRCQPSSFLQEMPSGSDHLCFFLSSLLSWVAPLPSNACASQCPPHCLSLFSFFIFVLPAVVPLPPAELLDDQHPVVRLLRRISSECPGGQPVSLDATLAHHLHQCSYHLRLFRNWLRSGQDDPECLYGTPCHQAGCCHYPGWDWLLCLLHFWQESPLIPFFYLP